ncbi:MAG TPA: DUF47 family protein [Candidatus Limnocylindrales bacterium]
MTRLIPRDERFFALLADDSANLLEAAQLLQSMLTSYDRLDERVDEIRRVEHAGDVIDHEIELRLEKAFITPFDREDIHTLVSRLDDVVDGVQEIAETCVIYDIQTITDEGRQLADILAGQAIELRAAVAKLDGFKGIDGHLRQVHELENRADALSRSAVARLFREEKDAVNVIKWRDVYRVLEDTIDAAEDAAEVIERMWHKAG